MRHAYSNRAIISKTQLVRVVRGDGRPLSTAIWICRTRNTTRSFTVVVIITGSHLSHLGQCMVGRTRGYALHQYSGMMDCWVRSSVEMDCLLHSNIQDDRLLAP